MHIVTRILLGVSFLFLGFPVLAQQPIVYPAKGQTAAQQSSDEAECYGWAKQSTGLDPALISQVPQAQAAPPPSGPAVGGGQRVAGALRGAAGGAIIGEIVDDDAGEGAAIGAVVGTMAGGRRARQQQLQMQQQQQQTHSQQQQQMDTFSRAYAACMEGRGYIIR